MIVPKKKIRRIIQSDVNGCGLACVAMVTNHTYAEVRKKAFEKLTGLAKNGYLTTSRDVKSLLNIFGFEGSRLIRFSFKNISKIPDLCLFKINRHFDAEGVEYWHWVVFVRDDREMYILDPKKSIRTNKRKDWGRMNVVSYMSISKQQL
ncbi:cysteine peptidase family C39 domain-containing protein [Desulfovibrio ferrophilus]|uniref:Peptidase C39 domain-containing protein n=1 Tax=Desulfovibrio ferrophilus TaxID=241368 RepID=A0A2Z6AZ06_9BACT|nr:cysteine peptidase family C39 domain-containing protein [Desulfovibrio ferrophilus]BBD08494.1 uncharacterized protein DFE_1768 [Desulfovibrio ferrophilus]